MEIMYFYTALVLMEISLVLKHTMPEAYVKKQLLMKILVVLKNSRTGIIERY